jgi:hypothetical protein
MLESEPAGGVADRGVDPEQRPGVPEHRDRQQQERGGGGGADQGGRGTQGHPDDGTSYIL